MERLVEILRKAVSDGASDIFIVAGGALSYKVDGEIRPMEASAERLMPDDTKVLLDEIYECASREKTHFLEEGDDDFSFAIEDLARFRVNSYFQRGSQAAVIRVVSFRIPDYKDLGIPEEVIALSKLQHGMIIISGTAGSGKSTTQACIIDAINKEREAHIITLELSNRTSCMSASGAGCHSVRGNARCGNDSHGDDSSGNRTSCYCNTAHQGSGKYD